MSAVSAAVFTAVFFSLDDIISAGMRILRRVLSNGAGFTRATCFIDAAANILISFEPSCRTCKQRDQIIYVLLPVRLAEELLFKLQVALHLKESFFT